jgi:hypothetical protein
VAGYGNTVLGTVTLNGMAPPGDATVTLTSDQAQAVVPASVKVLSQQTSATSRSRRQR